MYTLNKINSKEKNLRYYNYVRTNKSEGTKMHQKYLIILGVWIDIKNYDKYGWKEKKASCWKHNLEQKTKSKRRCKGMFCFPVEI